MIAPIDTGAEQLASNLLAAVVASSDDAIISKTLAGIITSWNASAERIFGYSASEAIGSPIAILAPPGNEGEMPALLARVSRGERIAHFETTRRHKTGALVPISLSISPILDSRGQIIGASKIARDITASKASAAALHSAEARLLDMHRELLHATRLRELGQVAATLAHEINQPLSAIASYLAGSRQLLIQNDLSEKVELDEALRRASDQVVRASDVVRRLRSYSKPSDGLLLPALLGDIVEETAALATIDSSATGVTLDLSQACNPIMVNVDRVEVQQVLLNLFRNAFEAMAGEDRRELSVSSRSTAGMAEISVRDTGSGINPRIRERLFLPFATTKADGMGIGLSICRKIVQARGGKIWAEHPADGGTAFIFTMPLAP
jgi:two-component system sensor kinase FixL